MKVLRLLNNLLQAVGDKFYDKTSAIWSIYERMTIRKAIRIEKYDPLESLHDLGTKWEKELKKNKNERKRTK